jgi:hypothetical protein
MKKKDVLNPMELSKEAEKIQSNMYEFEVLLENATGMEAKKKLLWKQIYRNAVDDRSMAGVLFKGAYEKLGDSASDHIALGGMLVKYLEKMSKSNELLLELSKMIVKDEEQAASISSEDIFSRIEGKS